MEQLEIGELIGKGRFGQVYHGRWHGEVAIRLIDIERDNEEQLKAFKREVMAYRNTRHENVVLFMGACMRPLIWPSSPGRLEQNFVSEDSSIFPGPGYILVGS